VKPFIVWLVFLVVCLFLVVGILIKNSGGEWQIISWPYQQFLSLLPKKQLKLASSPNTIIVSQDLWSIATKQKQLRQLLAKNASPSAEQLSQFLYSQPLLSQGVTQKGNQWVLSTNSQGIISYPLPKGTYKITASPISLYDITNLPQSLVIEDQAVTLDLGLKVGSGKIFLHNQFNSDPLLFTPNSPPPQGQQYFIVNLFHDKNNNQKLDAEETLVPWAGVILTLEKQPETGFGKFLR
jgi:hypothetical protein